MDITNDPAQAEIPPRNARPEFLKIICILSFIGCGVMILVYALGTLALAVDQQTILGVWDQMIERTPELEEVDPLKFFHQLGMVSLYCLLANIVSLVGVIMMWRLEKPGFFIYTVAELVTYFFTMDAEFQKNSSNLGLFVMLIFDIGFIVMYFLNLKHMNGNKVHVSESTGI